MCFGGNDSPQQPVQPAPYPWATLDVHDSRGPDGSAHGNGQDQDPTTSPTQKGTGVQSSATSPTSGANYNNIGM